MGKKSKPKFKEGQVLAVIPTVKHPFPRPRYISVDYIHKKDGKFLYKDATVILGGWFVCGWFENELRCLTKQEAGRWF